MPWPRPPAMTTAPHSPTSFTNAGRAPAHPLSPLAAMDRGVLAWATFVGTLVLLLLLTILWRAVPSIQDTIIFDPKPLDPTAHLVAGRMMEFIKTSDGERLATLEIKASPPARRLRADGEPLVSLYFHGRRGNMAHAVSRAHVDAEHGLHTFMVDYRGYGASTGTPSEAGLFLDGEALLAHVQEVTGAPRRAIVLHGYSLGCTVAVHLAARHDDFAALVLEAPFKSLRSATLHIYPPLSLFRAFMTTSFSNLDTVARVGRTPLLVAHSRTDECVAFADGQAVYEACHSPTKRFRVSARVSHAGPHLVAPHDYEWLSALPATPAL